jgi:PAS domain-containing protein
MDRYVCVWRYKFSHTDIVRFWVIVSLVFCSILITTLAFARQVETIFPQLFYFPILYATYFFRKRGILIAGICAVAFQSIAYYYLFPDTVKLGYSTGQAILFILISVVVAYFLEKMDTIEERYSSIFKDSPLGIILFEPDSFAITFTNRQVETMLGYASKELAMMTFPQFFLTKEE